MTAGQLADALGVSYGEIVKKLVMLGYMVSATQSLERDVIELLADDSGFILKDKITEDITKFEEIEIENLIIPKMIFTLKISLKGIYGKERFKYILLINLLIGILYGGSSTFREDMLNKGKMSIFATSKATIDDFLILE